MAVYQKYIDAEYAVEVETFLRLIRADVSNEQLAGWLGKARPPLNWQYIGRLANRHQVVPILYFNVRKLGYKERLPADVYDYLRAGYLRVTADNMRFRQQLVDMVTLLESRGVPAVPFKGLVMAQALYGDSALRQSLDIDLLVPVKDVVRAREIMASAGYRSQSLRLNRAQFKKFIRHNKALELVDDAGRVQIDLHWRLAMHTRHPYDYVFCSKRLTTIKLEGHPISCLSPEDMMVYLCLNGTSDAWMNVSAALWVAEYIAQFPALDWALMLELADMLCCRRMLFLGLFLARDLFDVSLPAEITAWVEKDRVVRALAEQVYVRLFGLQKPTGYFRWRMAEMPFQLKARDNRTERARYLLGRLFWPTQKDWQKRPLPAGLTFLYFVLRPLGLMIEGIKNRK